MIIDWNDSNLLSNAADLATPDGFYVDPHAATQNLRRVAARNLGIADQMDHGTVDEYRNLDRATQLALTDEMARLIMMYPQSFPQNVQEAAVSRVNNSYYGQSEGDESFAGNAVEQLADGTMFNEAAMGGLSYVAKLGLIAAVAYLVGQYINRPQPQTT